MLSPNLPIRNANILGRFFVLALLFEDGNNSPKSEETTVDGHALPLSGGLVAGRLFHTGALGAFRAGKIDHMKLSLEREGSVGNFNGSLHLDGEDAVRTGRLLVHLGLADVPLLLGTIHQVEDIGRRGNSFLGQSSANHTVLTLHHYHLVVAIGEQVA
jgi:hypothetical protein